MTKPTETPEPAACELELFSVEIGLFDEAEHEDNHRVVPLARYLHELRNLPDRAR
ncbi:hypothetical protein [Roseicyclus sp.]|uniref:hypothetical protein n=1 Tax=Roseicyclus sp. TaxID=1914329 RepID=UPI003F6B45F1